MTPQEIERLRELTEAGKSAAQIAEIMFYCPQTIWYNQRRHGIRKPQRNRTRISREADEDRRNAWRIGLTDSEAAMVLGISVEAFKSWRVRENLPPNKKKKRGTRK